MPPPLSQEFLVYGSHPFPAGIQIGIIYQISRLFDLESIIHLVFDPVQHLLPGHAIPCHNPGYPHFQGRCYHNHCVVIALSSLFEEQRILLDHIGRPLPEHPSGEMPFYLRMHDGIKGPKQPGIPEYP